MLIKKTLLLILFLSLSSISCSVIAQDSSSGELPSGAESEEIMIASGGTVKAVCTGNVPFKSLMVSGGFNNIVIDPETGKLGLNIDILKESEKNILNFQITTAFSPEEFIGGFLKGNSVPLNDENFMLGLISTNKVTGQVTNVGNEVRRIVEGSSSGQIDVDRSIPVKGNIKIMTNGNLASGVINIVFSNTSRQIEAASEVTGEDITIDENGNASAIARFDDIPINGSFENLAGLDPSNLPKGVMLENLPDGIDFTNLPSTLMITSLPQGITFTDLVSNIPPGFNLQDVVDLPDGFSIEDLSKLPPNFGFNPADLGFLPENFNLDDLKNLPPNINLSEIPPDKIKDLVGVQIPPGVNIDTVIEGIVNGTIDPKNIPDPNNIDPSTICENGQVKPQFLPFLPVGFVCPTIPTGSSGTTSTTTGGPSTSGIPSGIDPSQLCENGQVKPQFQPFVPVGFVCP